MKNLIEVAREPARVPNETPMGALGRGAVAGLVATLILSMLARIMPGMGKQSGAGEHKQGSKPPAPQEPYDPQKVREWQERAQSPAAYQSSQGDKQAGAGGAGSEAPPGITPAGALAQPQGPGPEGLAEQFTFKVASGIFGQNISPYMRPAGLALHVVYGSTWGMLYGLLQASYLRPPGLFGSIYGLVVWLVGPAILVPAMKLMPPPQKEQPDRTAMMVVGHIVYGLALATTFEILEKELV